MEEIIFDIVGFDVETGIIAVKFSDVETTFKATLPIRDGLFIEGEELKNFISSQYPHHIKYSETRSIALKNGIPNAEKILSLVNPKLKEIINPDPILDAVSLEQCKDNAKSILNQNINSFRVAHFPWISQGFSYIHKYEEAKNLIENSIQPTSGYVFEEAKIRNITVEALALKIIEKHEFFIKVFDPKIESLRIKGQLNIESAKDISEVDSSLRTVVSEMQALME